MARAGGDPLIGIRRPGRAETAVSPRRAPAGRARLEHAGIDSEIARA
jgi:hypothetical protein